MARATLKQRRDQLKLELKELNDKRLEEFLVKNGNPDKVFKCGWYGEIEELPVDKVYLIYPKLPHAPFNREPTKIVVSELEEHLSIVKETEPKFLVLFAKFSFERAYWDDILSHKTGLSFNEEDLKELSDRNREIYAPREGFTACEYCGVQVKNEELVLKPIWGKSRLAAGSTYTTKENYCFCSGTCAMHAQMSREG